jgi:hypothetical protein
MSPTPPFAPLLYARIIDRTALARAARATGAKSQDQRKGREQQQQRLDRNQLWSRRKMGGGERDFASHRHLMREIATYVSGRGSRWRGWKDWSVINPVEYSFLHPYWPGLATAGTPRSYFSIILSDQLFFVLDPVRRIYIFYLCRGRGV